MDIHHVQFRYGHEQQSDISGQRKSGLGGVGRGERGEGGGGRGEGKLPGAHTSSRGE